MSLIQNLIYKVEVGGGIRFLKPVIVTLVVLVLLVAYDLRAYKNISAPEAMDVAQLGRNIAEGKGYTTLFVRPFSMYLQQQRNSERLGPPPPGKLGEYSQIKGAHPDISNPPVYPVMLAGLMKVLPFQFKVDTTHAFWSVVDTRFPQTGGRHGWRYQPDFLITIFNQLLFLGVIVSTFFWARRLFDLPVARMSAVLLLGTELFWRFSVSGLSTMLLLLLFMGLIWCLTWWEAEMREPKWGAKGALLLSVAAGVLVGIGGLTRYAFLWLILPVLAFLILFGGTRRAVSVSMALLAFSIVVFPWIIRNYQVSGQPLGTATYTVLEGSSSFPQHRLERSLEPDLAHSEGISAFSNKLRVNARDILENDLPKLGGGWIGAFYLVGLLIAFRNPALQRLRYFLLFCLGVLFLAQALGQTQLSVESPEINSENLLVLLAPLVVVYGVSLFFMLLDQIELPARELRYVIYSVFVFILCVPHSRIFSPRATPIAYPPYEPQIIQEVSGLLKSDELIMSDMPWAVAWYGNRQCVWLTLNATPNINDQGSRENFFTINDFQKQIHALYLTPETMDSRFVSDWVRAGELSWGSFIIEIVIKNRVPPMFPLRTLLPGYSPEQLFLWDGVTRPKTEISTAQ